MQRLGLEGAAGMDAHPTRSNREVASSGSTSAARCQETKARQGRVVLVSSQRGLTCLRLWSAFPLKSSTQIASSRGEGGQLGILQCRPASHFRSEAWRRSFFSLHHPRDMCERPRS